MGWGTGDLERVEDAKVKVGFARRSFYELRSKIKTIVHTEKREVMETLCDEIYERLDRIEFHLKR